jgi:RNA polymerase sigma factor (sigma-70 family)
MPTRPVDSVIQHFLADPRPAGGDAPDGELLAVFLGGRDDAALAALVRRHAAMVWGVCRRILDHHDAEDAFQATFLVLVRKAAGVPRQAVAGWLYGVARQTAVRVRATTAKRRRRESQVANMPEPTAAEGRDGDLQSVLGEELGRLPGHYRGVVVLCDLEGLTRGEAARHLGIPEGSVASRLSRARTMLAKRLARRGFVFSGGPVAAARAAGPASASAPPALVASTIRNASLLAAGRAAGVVSAQVVALAEGVVKAMFAVRIRSSLAMLLVAGLALAGAAGLIYRARAGEPPAGQQPPAAGAQSAHVPARDAKDETLNLEEPVQAMRWSRDGSVMASLSTRESEVDGKKVTLSTFRVWDGRTGKLKLNHGEVEYPGFGTFDLSPDGKTLAVSSRHRIEVGDRVELYDAEKGTLLTTVEMDYGRSRPWFAFSPDSRTLAVCGFEFKDARPVGTVRLFGTAKGELRQKLFGHGGQVISVAFSSDGKCLAAGCSGGEITVWDAATGKIRTKLDAAGSIPALALSADGGLLAGGGSRGGRVWDSATGKSHELQAPEGEWRVNELAFSPDGRHVAGDGGLVKKGDRWLTRILVWDAATGKLRHEWLGLRGFAFTPDSKRLAILQDPKTVKLMGLGREQPVRGGQDVVPGRPQQAETDEDRIAGGWVVVNENSGRKGELWAIGEHQIVMNPTLFGYITRQYFHRLDAAKTPRQIDITVTNVHTAIGPDSPRGPNAKVLGVIKGIYSLDDAGELRLCLGEVGKDRPAAFPEKPKPGEVLVLHHYLKEERLKALIDKVLEAHGGEEKLAELQFTMTVKHSNGETQQYFVQPPKNFRWETTHPDRAGKRIVILFPEGRRWWTKEPNEAAKEFHLTGVEPLTVEGWYDYVKFFGPRQVLRLKDADHKVALLDEEVRIGGLAAVGVQVAGPHYNHKMYFDKETHLLLKSFGVNLREVTYGDYEKFDGVPVARKEKDGYFEPEVTDFKVVEKFGEKLFEQP